MSRISFLSIFIPICLVSSLQSVFLPDVVKFILHTFVIRVVKFEQKRYVVRIFRIRKKKRVVFPDFDDFAAEIAESFLVYDKFFF